MVVALRNPSLAYAGILTLALLAVPPTAAGAGCEAGASSLADGSLGLSCSASEETTGVAVDTCFETMSDEGYLFEDGTNWQTPAWSDGSNSITETPCAAHEGEGSCEAWADGKAGLFPNQGADCSAGALPDESPVDRVCLELFDGRWLFLNDAFVHSTPDCGADGASQEWPE